MSACGRPAEHHRPRAPGPGKIGVVGRLLLRAGLVLLYPDLPGRGDEPLHYVEGVLTAHVGEAAIGRWAPGYEAFLAAVFAIAGPEPQAARWAQVALGTLIVAGAYALGFRAGGRRTARVAGLLAALYPGLVAYPQYLYSETLFTALLVAAACVLHRTPGGPTRAEQVAAGVLFGLTALTRAVVLYFLPLWLLFALVRRRPAEARAAE